LQKLISNPLIIALDVDTEERALQLASELSKFAGAFKLGPRLIHRHGQELVRKVAMKAPVFVDCKFFDIPSTMEAAVSASFDSGATLVTIHALSGKEALQRLAVLEKELNKIRPFKILCVTILTSWDDQSLPPVMKRLPISELVKSLADLVLDSGLSGVVCSPNELSLLAANKFFAVTPGIRLPSSKQDDQKRTMTPEEAFKSGASALVVGRPIIDSESPAKVAQEIIASLK
jgi:orotidine-5'-phosphate decarboxylase